MSLLQILQILRAHYRVALGVSITVILVGVVVTLLLPKEYTATASLVVDVKTDPITGMLGIAAGSPGYIATQTDIIQSERVAAKVVSLLHLNQNPMAVARWKEETEGRIPLESYWGDLLKKGLQVQPTRGSNIITISYTAQDSKFVSAVANAFTQAYIGVTIDLHVEPARQYAAWYDERLLALRETLEAAQTKLSAYQKEKGITATDERVDEENARLSALVAELSQAQAETATSVSRQKNSGSELSPDAQQNPIVQSLKGDLTRAETQLAAISSNVGANHPQRIQLESSVAGLRKQLNEELRRVSGISAAATHVSKQRETELKSLIEAQKQKILALRGDRDQLDFLVREVESAQRTYDLVVQRISQNSLESQLDQTNVRVLSPAVEPIHPSGPKVGRNIAASIIMGLLAGVGIAIGMEFLHRRVRTPEDLAVAENLPVLGILRTRPSVRTFRERVDGLIARFDELRRRRQVKTA